MRRAVVLRALGLGDVLTVVPALRALRRGLGAGWVVELLAPSAYAVLVAGEVDAVVDTPAYVGGEPMGCRAVGHVAPEPDLAVNLHGRGPQSTAALAALRPGRLVAFGDEVPWRDEEHERARWCRLVVSAGLAASADPDDLLLSLPAPPSRDRPALSRALRGFLLDDHGRGAVVVHPGAASEVRRWPAERFAAVARALASGDRVVVTGSAAERPLAARVAAAAGLPDAAVLAGRTSLAELAALVSSARLVVCGDTGVAHLASAYATPSVVLFGPTPPARWGPPDRPWHRVLWAGHVGDPHAAAPDPGLLEITVPDVLAAATEARHDANSATRRPPSRRVEPFTS